MNRFISIFQGNFFYSNQYTGREYDDFTKLYYYRARWYDAQIGRFISEDPIGFAGGDVNLYGYVKNKPLNSSDPFRLDEYSMMERLATRQPSGRSFNEMLDDLQLMLGGLGQTPGLGEPFDGIDGLISLGRGDYVGASLSGAAMFPFIGAGAGITKICKRMPEKQTGELIDRLRDGETIHVDSVEDARHILDKMPDLRPGGKQMPTMVDPRGTFRGDLLDTKDPFGLRLHKDGVRNDHGMNPHYNMLFHDGTKAAIIIKKY